MDEKSEHISRYEVKMEEKYMFHDMENDITHVHLSFEALSARKVADTIPHIVWMARPDGYREYFNQHWYAFTKTNREQVHGNGWLQWVHPDDRGKVLTAWRTAVQTDQLYNVRYLLQNGQTGAYHQFLSRGLPLKDTHGHVTRWLGTCTDIGEKTSLGKRGQISEAQFYALFESNILGVVLGDIQGNILDANEAWAQITGWTPTETRSGTFNCFNFMPPAFREQHLQATQELVETGMCLPYESEIERKDGRRVPILTGKALCDREHQTSIAFVLDITAQKELDKRKDECISLACHELKTPLTALKLLVQRLRQKQKREEDQERSLSLIEAQTTILTHLVNDLLDVSKIRQGNFDYADDLFDLEPMIREVVEQVQQATMTHTLCFHVTEAGPIHIVGDKYKLEQVVTNLLCNAIKYSPQAHDVEIFLGTSGDAAIIQVQDYGVGIPKQYQHTIFNRFDRGAYSQRKGVFPGLGLGLYLAHEIVTHYGGDIEIESEEGKGTTFSVHLPLPHEKRSDGTVSYGGCS